MEKLLVLVSVFAVVVIVWNIYKKVKNSAELVEEVKEETKEETKAEEAKVETKFEETKEDCCFAGKTIETPIVEK